MTHTTHKSILSTLNVDNSTLERIKPYTSKGNWNAVKDFIKEVPYHESFIDDLSILVTQVYFSRWQQKKPDFKSRLILFSFIRKEGIPNNPILLLQTLAHRVAYLCTKLANTNRCCYSISFEKGKLAEKHYTFQQHIQFDFEFDIESCPFDGMIFIPWQYVLFRDGYMYITHPRLYSVNKSEHSYKYVCAKSKTAFNYIKKSFTNKLAPIVAIVERGFIIKVLNMGDLDICVNALEIGKVPKIKLTSKKSKIPQQPISLDDLRIRSAKEYKSDYIEYLADKQLIEKSIIYTRECRINTNGCEYLEDAFIFQTSATTIIYENTLDDRSTLIFKTTGQDIEDVIEDIHAYFSSGIINKRDKIADNVLELDNENIVSIKRVYHTSLIEWKLELNHYL